MGKLILVVALFGISCLRANALDQSSPLVGIVEDDRAELADWKQGPSKERVIRPLFEKKDGVWKTNTVHPEEISWTIAFDGKNAGTVKSKPNTRDHHLNHDTHSPEPQLGQTLVIGKPSADFSGWEETLFNRPLVLVSGGDFKDPDHWKPLQLTADQTKNLIVAFKKEYPKVLNCNENEEPLPDPWPYTDANIKIQRTYGSDKGDILATLNLEGSQCGVSEGPFLNQLFLIRADQSTGHITLGTRSDGTKAYDGLSLFLVDAGDYDGDGESEVVFFVSGYNEDGYAMFFDSFHKMVMWTWDYH